MIGRTRRCGHRRLWTRRGRRLDDRRRGRRCEDRRGRRLDDRRRGRRCEDRRDGRRRGDRRRTRRRRRARRCGTRLRSQQAQRAEDIDPTEAVRTIEARCPQIDRAITDQLPDGGRRQRGIRTEQ